MSIQSLAFAQRLRHLASLTNRPPIRRIARKMPLPSGIELHGWVVGKILRPLWNETFGVKP